jgi:ATP-dependent DNA helicase RecQ
MYGRLFMDEIKSFLYKKSLPYNPSEKGSTQQYTYDLLQQGKSPEAIARERNISISTIYSHIASMYEKGNPVDMSLFLTKREQSEIFEAIKKHGASSPMKPIFEELGQKYDYGKIRLALALFIRK